MDNKDKLFAEVRGYAKELRSAHSERDEMLKDIEGMYLMHKTAGDVALEAGSPDIALTKSPDERVAIQAVVRLLTTSVPKVSMPREANYGKEDTSDMIEKGANALLASSDRANRRPMHYDAVLSGALYDLVSIRVSCAEDIMDQLEEGGMSAGAKERMKRALKHTPFIFEVLNPLTVYPVWDMYGLKAQLNVTKVKVKDIVGLYGEKALKLLGEEDELRDKELWDYTDDQYRVVWCGDEYLVCEEHGLPFLNIATSTVSGSGLFSEAVDQYEPFLYTVYRSGMDQRKTEALTATATMGRVYGLSPLLKYTRGPNDEEPPATQQVGLFSLWDVPNGAQLEPVLNKGITDPSVWNNLQLWMQKTEEATIYKSVLGQSQSNTYSQTALLSQLGRIPLDIIASMTGRCIADALEVALRWIKLNKKGVKAYNRNDGALTEIDPELIPDYFNLNCKLKPALPQDKLQSAQVAVTLVQAGVTSIAWVQENILDIEQPQDMRKEIWMEHFQDELAKLELQKAVMQPAQQKQEQEQAEQMANPEEMLLGGAGGIPREVLAGGMGGPAAPTIEEQMTPPMV